MPKTAIRACALAALALPLAGCFSYSEQPKPAPVVVQQPPPANSTVVVPQR